MADISSIHSCILWNSNCFVTPCVLYLLFRFVCISFSFIFAVVIQVLIFSTSLLSEEEEIFLFLLFLSLSFLNTLVLPFCYALLLPQSLYASNSLVLLRSHNHSVQSPLSLSLSVSLAISLMHSFVPKQKQCCSGLYEQEPWIGLFRIVCI